MSIQNLAAKPLSIDWFEDLPVGICVVDRDGVFLNCNQRALKLFKLEAGEILERTARITDFYRNPQEREKLLTMVEEAEKAGGFLERQVVSFRIAGEDVYLELNSRSCRNSATGELIGYVDCVTDITAEEESRWLFDLLSEGVYRVDEENKITYVNTATARLFGYESPAELIGRPLADLFVNKEDAEALQSSVEAPGSKEISWSMVRKDGVEVFCSVQSSVIRTPKGYGGFEGTIRDVTLMEQYRLMIDHLPVGSYMLHRQGDEDRIQSCNRAFAELFDYASERQVVGMRVKDLQPREGEYDEFLKGLGGGDTRADALLDEVIKTRTHAGAVRFLDLSAKLLRNHRGDVIGSVGVVRDVTEKEPLMQAYREFTTDIGNLLHSYSATLHTVVTSLRPAIDSLPRNPAEHLLEDEQGLIDQIEREAMQLARHLANLLDRRDADRRLETMIPPQGWQRLAFSRDLLLDVRSQVVHPEFIPPVIYDVAVEIHNLIVKSRGLMDRRTTREVLNQAWLLERLCSLAALRRVQDAVTTMEYETRALREWVIGSRRREEPPRDHGLASLIDDVISNVADYAREKRIAIRRRGDLRGSTIRVVRQEVVRALANLLHNAIKYSWPRAIGESAWIDIRYQLVQPAGRAGVRIDIENLGVAIAEEEIADGSIFCLGYRGRMASARRRTGTGLGLTDAKEVVEKYRGMITVTSRPARPGARENDYAQPFVTTVSVYLPISEW